MIFNLIEDTPGEVLLEPVDNVVISFGGVFLAPADVPNVSVINGLVVLLDPVDASPDVPDVTADGQGDAEVILATVDASPDVPPVLVTIAYPAQAHGQVGEQPRPRLFPGGMKGLVRTIKWNQQRQRFETVIEEMPRR
jgi:hypothetical protein